MSHWRPWQRIVVGVAAFAVLGAFLLFRQTRWQAPSSVYCLVNMKQLNLGLVLYAEDNHDVLPPGNWTAAAVPYTKTSNVARCPELKEGSGYAMNRSLLGRRRPEGEDLAMTFETNDLALGATATSLPPLDPPRHKERQMVGYVDGHVKPTPFTDLPKIRLR